MTENTIENEYFEWLFTKVCQDRYSENVSFRKLLMELHGTNFKYIISRDENRAADGIDMRHRFLLDRGYDVYSIDRPCSILEMMVALAVRCEETLMDDPRFGDRTTQWFWGMIVSLGLGSMRDDTYDKIFVKDVIKRFLKRDYEPNGKGGLFTIEHCDKDLRNVEIWYQLNWYLNSIL